MIRAAAALGGLLAVALGAFGAHGISDPQARAWIATGAGYGLAHAVAALWAADRHQLAAALLAAGGLLFAIALYVMALGGPRWLGMVAPVGGTLMLAGWAVLLIRLLRTRVDALRRDLSISDRLSPCDPDLTARLEEMLAALPLSLIHI